MPDALVPGSQYGMTVGPAPTLQPAPGQVQDQGTGLIPSYGTSWGGKMPADAANAADQQIKVVQGVKQKEGDTIDPLLFKFLGWSGTTWKDVAIYGTLTLLFFIGVIGLLNAAKGR